MRITNEFDNKQLLNGVQHISRMMKDDLCYPPKPKDEALIILDIMRKPNAIIVLLCIQKQKKAQTRSHFVYFSKIYKVLAGMLTSCQPCWGRKVLYHADHVSS